MNIIKSYKFFILFLYCVHFLFPMQVNAMHLFEDVDDYDITNHHWKVVALVQPECEAVSHRALFGHSMLAFIGKNDDDYVLWAADFGADVQGFWDIRGAVYIHRGYIRTTEDPDQTLKTALERSNYEQWSFTSWPIEKSKALEVIEGIKTEKIDENNILPYYNLFGYHVVSHYYYERPTYNCSSWVSKKVEQCGFHAPGTWFKRITGIAIPRMENAWAYNSDNPLQCIIRPSVLPEKIPVKFYTATSD